MMATNDLPELEYYADHSQVTDPGAYEYLFDSLPDDIPQLAKIVQGLLLHYGWLQHYGVTFSLERFSRDVFLRTVRQQMKRIVELSDTPLTEPHPPEKRLHGCCRDFTILFTAMLRHKGVPARARCGFATYFKPDHYEDHWVCQYWNSGENRWVLFDAQLDTFQRDVLGIGSELTEGQFLPAGQGWKACRDGKADPETFGYGKRTGMWFIRRNLVHDLFALNKIEMSAWDSWGPMTFQPQAIPPEQIGLLDTIANATHGTSPNLEQVQSVIKNDDRLRLPDDFSLEGPVMGFPLPFRLLSKLPAFSKKLSRLLDPVVARMM